MIPSHTTRIRGTIIVRMRDVKCKLFKTKETTLQRDIPYAFNVDLIAETIAICRLYRKCFQAPHANRK